MSTAQGQAAEAVAAEFLITKGCTILARNWRTRWCEIDIVAKRHNIIYLVEVKYRASATWGAGLDYVTPQKVTQMRFAAEFWRAKHKFAGDLRLSAVALTGDPPRVVAAVKSIES